MKAILFHFMNALRVPIMFASKLLLWIVVLIAFLAWGAHFEWFAGPYKDKDPLAVGIAFTVFAFGLYYFRWKYDVILILLKPKDVEIMAVAKDDTHIAGKN